MLKRTAALTISLLVASAAWAQNTPVTDAKPAASQPEAVKKLTIGDKAPPLAVEKWVKGEPVTGFEKGNVYIVEFWATWCGPCIASMPHLTELQKEYKDKSVRIIGVTSADTKGNTLDKVEAMVKDKADVMGYTVAWDTGRKTTDAYRKAANQPYIPCAFIVDREGRVAYIGDPQKMDDTLEQVVAGKHDIEKAKKDFQDQQKKDEAQTANSPAKFSAEYQSLLSKKEYDKAYELARKTMDGPAKSDPQIMNEIAWLIVDPMMKVENKDMDLATKAADRANELTKGEDPAILDTVARVYFIKGDKAKALELQKKAVDLAGKEKRLPADLVQQLKDTLKEYESAK